MSDVLLDARGLRCPHPTLKIAVRMRHLAPGDRLEVLADCPTFEKDLRELCARSGTALLWIRDEPDKVKRCLLQPP